jgi:predicted ATP-dependent serine protease
MAKRGRKPKSEAKPVKSLSKLKLKLTRMKDFPIDDNMFKSIKTGDETLDGFLSTEGGFMPATNIICVGDPGIGKSTVLLDMLSNVKITTQDDEVEFDLENDSVINKHKDKKVLFVSAEMNQIDMVGYCKRYPKFGEIDILFMADYFEEDPKQVIEKAFEVGYDMILIDSWAELKEIVREHHGWESRKAEHWLLGLLDKQNKGLNKLKKYTCFLIIQQVTKGGEFAGSNRLKHMTTGMMLMKMKNDVRHMYFVKNRRGMVGEIIEFSLMSENVRYSLTQPADELPAPNN